MLSELDSGISDESVSVKKVLDGLRVVEACGTENFLSLPAKRFVYLRHGLPVIRQEAFGPTRYGPVEHQRIIVRDEESLSGFVIEDILTHPAFLRLHDIRRIAHYEVEHAMVKLLFSVQHISTDEEWTGDSLLFDVMSGKLTAGYLKSVF